MPPAYPSLAIALLHLPSLCSTIVDSLTQRQQIQTPLMSPCPVVVVYKEQEKPTCFRTPNLQSGLEPLFLLIENTGTVSWNFSYVYRIWGICNLEVRKRALWMGTPSRTLRFLYHLEGPFVFFKLCMFQGVFVPLGFCRAPVLLPDSDSCLFFLVNKP